MRCANFRHVVALLHDNDEECHAVLERAVELAEIEHARLTLAKTTDPGWLVRWFCPMAPACRAAPIPEPDLTAYAERRLAALARTVPACTPLSMVLLTPDTTGSLCRLAKCTPFDLVVLSSSRLPRERKLRRELRAMGVSTLTVGQDLLPSAAPTGDRPELQPRSIPVT